MPLSKRRSFLYLGLIAGLLILAYLLRVVFHFQTDNALAAISMMTARWLIQVPLTVLWIVSIHRRILNTAIRRMLLSVGGLLLFWQVVRVIKYDYVIITAPVGRYLWYAYYIPMVLVPLIGVFVVNHIGKPEGYHSPRWMKWLFVPAFILIAIVFTNDLHQKVFVFYDGFALYNNRYAYGFLYFIVMAWFMSLALFFVISLMAKSRVPGSKSFQKLPLIITFFAILFWSGYSLKLYAGDLTAVDCLIIIMLLESSIQSGLIPSNMNYRRLFDVSALPAQIMTRELQEKYATKSAGAIEKDVLLEATRAPVALGDTVLNSRRIRGGYVFWQDDVSEINRLTEHIAGANEILSEQYDLMSAEVSIREKQAQAEEKTRLYDGIARMVAPQLDRLDALTESIRLNRSDAHDALCEICVLSAYIKRKANLILLGDESPNLKAGELALSLRESLDNLCLTGVRARLDAMIEGDAQAERILKMYDWFEEITEKMLGKMNEMTVTLRGNEKEITLGIRILCKNEAGEIHFSGVPGGRSHQSMQGAAHFIEATVSRGGEAA